MVDQVEISVVISTYNRCDRLSKALENLFAQNADGVTYEVIVVDNNSTDRTREVVESFKARGFANLHYTFEPKQGVSHGRNKGIASAKAEIIAFTDDDVRVNPDWVVNMKRAFDDYPEADCVGGKILPHWEDEPPKWLTRDHWWPLSLVDFGDEPFHVNVDKPICLPTANAAFRRSVFNTVASLRIFPERKTMNFLCDFCGKVDKASTYQK